VTLDVSTIVVDTNCELELVTNMVNNPNEDCHEKSVGKPKELGKGDCVGGCGDRRG